MARTDYLSKVKKLTSSYTRLTSHSTFDGSFKSVYRGRTGEFDDLREYVYGDDARDIDWKSSIRTGKTLVKRFEVSRRHNVTVICDCGKKMGGDTPSGGHKADIALQAAGVAAYIVNAAGDTFSFMTQDERGCWHSKDGNGLGHLGCCLAEAEKRICSDGEWLLSDLINHAMTTMSRNRIIIIVTDQAGLAQLDETLIRRVCTIDDVILFNIEDAYLFESGMSYDMEDQSLERNTAKDAELLASERAERDDRISKFKMMSERYTATLGRISSEDDIVPVIMTTMSRNGGRR